MTPEGIKYFLLIINLCILKLHRIIIEFASRKVNTIIMGMMILPWASRVGRLNSTWLSTTNANLQLMAINLKCTLSCIANKCLSFKKAIPIPQVNKTPTTIRSLATFQTGWLLTTRWSIIRKIACSKKRSPTNKKRQANTPSDKFISKIMILVNKERISDCTIRTVKSTKELRGRCTRRIRADIRCLLKWTWTCLLRQERSMETRLRRWNREREISWTVWLLESRARLVRI